MHGFQGMYAETNLLYYCKYKYYMYVTLNVKIGD